MHPVQMNYWIPFQLNNIVTWSKSMSNLLYYANDNNVYDNKMTAENTNKNIGGIRVLKHGHTHKDTNNEYDIKTNM